MAKTPHLVHRIGASAAACAALLALAVLGCQSGSKDSEKNRPATVPKVTVVAAQKRNIPVIGRPNGTTRALNEVTVRARVKGFLKEKHFNEGANVKKDQLLLVIDEEPFKAQVDQAKAKLDAAEADLEKATKSKSREVARAQVELDQAGVDLARIEEKREANLLAKSATSRESFDRAQAMRKKSEAQVRADEASLLQSQADFDANLLIARANVAKAKADLTAARIDLSYCRMFSPIDGRAGELQVKLGNLVGPATGSTDTTSLVAIKQLDPMGIDIRPASRYLPVLTRLVKVGLEVKLKVQGQRTHPHQGRVTFVDNTVDPTTSTVLVRAAVPNPEQSILPGEYVKADLTVGEYTSAVVIPDVAVMEAQEGSRVLVVDERNTVQPAIVKPLDRYQGLLVLESGLEAGQKVIVSGVQLVRVGQVVQPTEVDLEKYLTPDSDREFIDPLSSPLLKLRDAETPPPASPPAVAPPPDVKRSDAPRPADAAASPPPPAGSKG